MPNWCSNEVTVYFDTDEDKTAFKEFAFTQNGDGDSFLDFNKIIPTPDNVDAYDYHVSNWGTKWAISEMALDEESDGERIQMAFETAWSPPTGIYDAITDKFPDMTISWFYREDGMQFSGYLPD